MKTSLTSNERRWLMLYKEQIARGEVCPECDGATRIEKFATDTGTFFCRACGHSWDGGEVTP